nr:CBM_HP1_G0001030.mRNA.1.CDS.1 [Saccharomyces cerevisiae]
MGSPNIMASYDPDLLSIQQLNLSRTTSVSGPSGYSDDAGVPNVNRNIFSNSAFVSGNSWPSCAGARATSVNDRSRFNNLDKLLSSSIARQSHLTIHHQTNGLSQANGTVSIPNATTEKL